MIKFQKLAVALIPLTVLAACSSDDDDAAVVEEAVSSVGTYQVTLTNRSATQPMTPPVVVVHDPSVQLFVEGEAAGDGIVAIAEDGNNDILVGALPGIAGVSSFAVGLVDPAAPGPLRPGNSATINVTSDTDGQVISVVSMVVCTNDGFSAIDSAAFPEITSTETAPIFDAGSEVNELMLNYWVPPCSGDAGSENLHTDEGGVITAHPGQSGSEGEGWDFAAGSQLLEVTITRN